MMLYLLDTWVALTVPRHDAATALMRCWTAVLTKVSYQVLWSETGLTRAPRRCWTAV